MFPLEKRVFVSMYLGYGVPVTKALSYSNKLSHAAPLTLAYVNCFQSYTAN